jgi:exodeoxyribonuclease V alpha subunit
MHPNTWMAKRKTDIMSSHHKAVEAVSKPCTPSSEKYVTQLEDGTKLYSDYPFPKGRISYFKDIGTSNGRGINISFCHKSLEITDKSVIETTGDKPEDDQEAARLKKLESELYAKSVILFNLMEIGVGLKLATVLFEVFAGKAVNTLLASPYDVFIKVVSLKYLDLIEMEKALKTDLNISYNRLMHNICLIISRLRFVSVGKNKGVLILGENHDKHLHFVKMKALIDGMYRDLLYKNKDMSILERKATTRNIILDAIKDNMLVAVKDKSGEIIVGLSALIGSERSIARKIHRVPLTPIYTEQEVIDTAASMGITLHEDQIKAIVSVCSNSMSFLIGGPGTGKTMVTSVIRKLFHDKKKSVIMVAPTGKAANRSFSVYRKDGDLELIAELEEKAKSEPTSTPEEKKRISDRLRCDVSKIRTSTIHYLLDQTPNKRAMREYDIEGDLLIVDETSMIDLYMMQSLLKWVTNKTIVLFVGDANQLPSVGPGAVLRDIVDYHKVCDDGSVCINELTFCFRAKSHLIKNAKVLLETKSIQIPTERGERVNLNPDNPSGEGTTINEWTVITTKKGKGSGGKLDDLVSEEDVATRVMEVVKSLLKMGVKQEEMQVLSSGHKWAHGTYELNLSIQDMVNEQFGDYKDKFRTGDKIICTSNLPEHGIANGDQGIVRSFVKGKIVADFGDNLATLKKANGLRNMSLGYVTTVHKSQGSEYKVVIMVLHHVNTLGSHKSLIYTGITRAKKACIIIGTEMGIYNGINQDKRYERVTSLVKFLTGEFESIHPSALEYDANGESFGAVGSSFKNSISEDDYIEFDSE